MTKGSEKKTVIFLCGIIGSGKTTYAKRKYRHFTDLDYLPKYSKKCHQIAWTKKLLENYDEVCHITCYPTLEEIQAFENFNKKYILIDTGIEQAKTNILIRNRERDMNRLTSVLDTNKDYVKQYKNSTIVWEKVKVFK